MGVDNFSLVLNGQKPYIGAEGPQMALYRARKIGTKPHDITVS